MRKHALAKDPPGKRVPIERSQERKWDQGKNRGISQGRNFQNKRKHLGEFLRTKGPRTMQRNGVCMETLKKRGKKKLVIF